MKKTILFLNVFFLISFPVHCQLWKLRRAELMISPGLNHFFGDLGGYPSGENALGFRDVSPQQVGMNIGMGLRYRLTEKLSSKVILNTGMFHSSDAHGHYVRRGYEETTFFVESELTGEYYFIRNKVDNNYLFIKNKRSSRFRFIEYIDFYGFAGIGAISYNARPNSKLFPYATGRTGFYPVIPAGIGAIKNFPGGRSFGIEIGGRYAFSDEIDDFAPPTSKSNDIYYFLNITFNWKLKTGGGF